MNLTVDLNRQMLEDVQSRLGGMSNKAPNAITSALNRTLTNIASNVSKEVRKEYNIKASDVKQTITKTKASRSNMTALVVSKGNLVPLDRFKVSPRAVQPKRKKPIKVGVKKDGGLKTTVGAFVSDINGIKVFQREGRKRLPVKRLFGPSVPQMLGNDEVVNRINQEGALMFNNRIDHEINRILGRGQSTS
ncbi:phage tail protein [Niallia taxi]|uniref:phage tail protein n=1 Tax=Niallia taxi TaxID=2499688 RepID=UPI003981A22A